MNIPLLGQIGTNKKTKRDQLAPELREIAARAHNPKPGDAERLETIMGILGLTADDIQKYVSFLDEFDSLRPLVESLPSREQEAANAGRDSREYAAAAYEERNRYIAEQDAKIQALDVAARSALAKVSVAHEAKSKLATKPNSELYALLFPDDPLKLGIAK